MKQRMSVLIAPVIAAVLLLTGCMSEPREPQGFTKGDTRKITFALPAIFKAPATYVAAEGRENDLDHLEIYMFNGDDKTLELIFHNDEITVDKTGAKPTATIDVTERSGDKEFFFVANGNGITSELGKIRHGETTITEFIELVSDKKAALPSGALLMSGRLALSAVENANTADPDDLKPELTRRVARFDIDNDSTATNFKITKILVGKVSKHGYIFGDATGTPARTITAENADEVAFGATAGDNGGLTKSVFYTYPTTIGDGKTEISLEGDFRGQARIFTLRPADGNDIKIEANKRYTLKAVPIDINEIALEITVKDWEVGEEVTAEPDSNLVDISPLKLIDGDGVLVTNDPVYGVSYDVTKATRQSVLRFQTKSFRKSGTEATVTYIKGTATDFPITFETKPEPVLTYADACYVQDYEITIPVKATAEAIEILIEVSNVYDPIQTVSMMIIRSYMPRYQATADTVFPGVLVAGKWWAPVNVGATTMNGTAAGTDAGLIYQWGRSYIGFPTTGTVPTVGGPQTEVNARTTHGTKYILGSANPWHWLTPANSNLWNGDDRRGPCPEGWKIPNDSELQIIVNAFTNKKATIANNILKVNSDRPGEYLYLQQTGCRGYSNGALDTSQSRYWSATTSNPGYTRTNFIILTSSSITLSGHIATEGGFVRCIYDPTQLNP